jgi:phage tail-like protein
MANERGLLPVSHFKVDVQGMVTGYFLECSGLGSENEVIEHKVITETGQELVITTSGRLKWEQITLKRGITESMDMWEWRQLVEEGKTEEARRNGSITMYNQKGEAKAQWDFRDAWPVKLSGPQPKTDSNDIGVEELVIQHEYIKRTKL